MIGPANPCDCGDVHYYTPELVNELIHAAASLADPLFRRFVSTDNARHVWDLREERVIAALNRMRDLASTSTSADGPDGASTRKDEDAVSSEAGLTPASGPSSVYPSRGDLVLLSATQPYLMHSDTCEYPHGPSGACIKCAVRDHLDAAVSASDEGGR